MTTKLFDSIIMLRFDKKEVAKNNFMVQKIGMLMLII